jgi:hypothetical protein
LPCAFFLMLPSVIQLRAFGFDGYAIEYVDCPDGLLWYLHMEIKLHRTVRTLTNVFFVVSTLVARQSR